MKIGEKGLKLIQSFEGCRLKAYHIAGEAYYTIGYGHYGPDVAPDMTITQQQAEDYMKADLVKFENYVNKASLTFVPNQNQFDALVSFTYNCGPGNLSKLVANRPPEVIAEKLLAYCNGKNPDVKKGLLRRRNAERSLFLEPAAGQPAKESGASEETVRVQAQHGLKCRQGPDVAAPVLVVFAAGTRLHVLEHTNEAWTKVTIDSYQGKPYTGYCSAKYLG